MSISVSMIVRNSSDVLCRCLESVNDADEIVIVDTGSDDNTIEIAKKYTDKVYEYWGCNEGGKKDGLFANFADARNYSLSKCTKTHVFTIDSDEELEPGGMEIMKAFPGKALSVKCVSGIHGEIHRQPRLYMRHPAIYWKGAAHNYLTCSGGQFSDVTITYWPNTQKKKDPDRTKRILERWVKKNPKNCTRELYYLAKEYFKRHWFKKAKKTFEKYIPKSEFPAEKADALVMLTRCNIGLNKYDEATNTCMAAININPEFKEALELAGELAPSNTNRLKWKHIASNAINNDVLFTRLDKRLKVTVLSKWDWAGSGYGIVKSVRKASGGAIDIEAITENEGVGSLKFQIQTGPGIMRTGKEVAEARIKNSDIIHFKGDWPFKDKFAGIELPQKAKRIYTVSGSLFRKPGVGLGSAVARNKFKVGEFKADYLSAITPDLCYNKGWHWMGHCWDKFKYSWKPAKKFRVLHVPSDPMKKGTDMIVEAMRILNRPDVEFICQTGIPHKTMMELKKTSHLYIEQMVIWVYSMASVEAMSMGIPVLSGINPGLYSKDCPVVYPIQRTPEEIAAKLNEILDWKKLKELSEQSFEYAKNVHGNMGKKWMEVYKNL
jgi:glycosyltransferase involved in cell wall biosynthesis